MAIIRWREKPMSLFPEFDRLQKEMDGLYSTFFRPEESGVTLSGVFPPLNVTQDEHNLYVKAELPGIKAEDIDISVTGENLTIKGKRETIEEDEKVNYHRREREEGHFRRIITLPIKVETGKVEATSKNGILTITLPKAEEAKLKKITVKAA